MLGGLVYVRSWFQAPDAKKAVLGLHDFTLPPVCHAPSSTDMMSVNSAGSIRPVNPYLRIDNQQSPIEPWDFWRWILEERVACLLPADFLLQLLHLQWKLPALYPDSRASRCPSSRLVSIILFHRKVPLNIFSTSSIVTSVVKGFQLPFQSCLQAVSAVLLDALFYPVFPAALPIAARSVRQREPLHRDWGLLAPLFPAGCACSHLHHTYNCAPSHFLPTTLCLRIIAIFCSADELSRAPPAFLSEHTYNFQ